TTSEEPGEVRVWDRATRRLVAEPLSLSRAVDARFEAVDQTVAVETETGDVYSFRVTRTAPLNVAPPSEAPPAKTPVPVTEICGIAATNFHTGLITMFEADPSSNLLATASTDDTACLWEMRPLKPANGPLHRLHHHDSENRVVNCVHFNRDGRRLVTSTADRRVRVWD